MKRRGLVAMVVLTLASGVVLAQVKPETLVKQRQGKMSLQGKYFFPLAAMAPAVAPNAEIFSTADWRKINAINMRPTSGP